MTVALECTARPDGRVEACTVTGETLPGLGFAKAAIALMQAARLEPRAGAVRFSRTLQFSP